MLFLGAGPCGKQNKKPAAKTEGMQKQSPSVSVMSMIQAVNAGASFQYILAYKRWAGKLSGF
jgi:hypothetical protein